MKKPKTSDTTYDEYRREFERRIFDAIMRDGLRAISAEIAVMTSWHARIVREGGFKEVQH